MEERSGVLDAQLAPYRHDVLDLLPAIGEVDPMLEAISGWLCSAIEPVKQT